ncbi:MAG TPA: FAD-binding protein [Atribacteraceae bacterium]|nr:FAD-binding protein [Atribacteraceae bacterium]
MNCDVVVVGAGPAGIFTALALAEKTDLQVLVVDRGPDIEKRRCPAREKNQDCRKCSPCSLLCGWGGAGAYSDGKLTFSREVGGQLSRYLDEDSFGQILEEVDSIYGRFGGTKKLYGGDLERVEEFRRRAEMADLILVPSRIRHLGTDRCRSILKNMRNYLEPKISVLTSAEASAILTRDGVASGVELADGKRIDSGYVVVAPGRVGADWLRREAVKLGLRLEKNPVDLGVRMEVPASITDEFTQIMYELKLVYYSRTFDDRVRTFCMCPAGEVVTEFNDGIITVNGHSYEDHKTPNTNFAILVSTHFTEPFREPIEYGRYVARLANILSDGVVIQRLKDLQMGRRSTWKRIEKSVIKPTLERAVPGDLSFVLPYRFLQDILEMIAAMENFIPGMSSPYNLLYGVEVKFYSSRIKTGKTLESEVRNLFLAGDGAGITRGLIQASASGIIVAREIIDRIGRSIQ